jgi:methylglyoxal synthase
MNKIKNIALVAHDNCKKDLIEWIEFNKEILSKHKFVCTGETGKLVQNVFDKDINLILLKSGHLGGDQQLGSMISNNEIDILIFFWDSMQPHSHDVDIKALLRISVLYNIPTACNRSTADFIISSYLFEQEYEPKLTDYSDYINRNI